MRKLVGEINVNATPEEIRLEAKQVAVETPCYGKQQGGKF
jgi:hypothetical protein